MRTLVLALVLLAGLGLYAWGRSARFWRRDESQQDAVIADRLAWSWREACEGAGISRRVDTVTGPTVTVPRLVNVTLGPPTVLVARLLPGQVAADVQAAAGRMAGHLGAVALRVEARGLDHVRVELLSADPLAGVVLLDDVDSGGPAFLARDEHGRDIRADLVDLPHLAVQGTTRSGKTAWLYALLSQAAARARRTNDVLVAGVDASGLLLRPFAGTRHAEWHAVGLADLPRVEAVLTSLVAEMDRRISGISADRDTVTTSSELPLILTVLEEWPGTLRALDADPADPKRGKRCRSLVARLLAESHKAGMRIVVVVQRAEAGIIGGTERAQCAGRLSFSVDTAESVRLLHPDVPVDVAERHTQAAPGVGLLSLPGRPLQRVRAPWIGSYSRFAASCR